MISRSNFLGEAEARRLQDEGFALVMRSLPDDPKPTDSPIIHGLRGLKQFREKHVIWAELHGDSVRSLADGASVLACMAILPAHHEIAQSQPSIYGTYDWGKSTLAILPYRMTPQWAGIGLVNGISQLKQMSAYTTAKDGPARAARDVYIETDVRAYYLELCAIDLWTKNQFRERLKSGIENVKLRTVADLTRVLRQESSQLIPIAKSLDEVITPNPPFSPAELSLRLGLYTVAIAFYLSEMNTEAGPDRFEAHKKVLETLIMTSSAHENFIPE